jgi:hypothetical protein
VRGCAEWAYYDGKQSGLGRFIIPVVLTCGVAQSGLGGFALSNASTGSSPVALSDAWAVLKSMELYVDSSEVDEAIRGRFSSRLSALRRQLYLTHRFEHAHRTGQDVTCLPFKEIAAFGHAFQGTHAAMRRHGAWLPEIIDMRR